MKRHPVLTTALLTVLAAGLTWSAQAAPRNPARGAGSANDGKIRQLLLSSAWCSFAYRGGVTNKEQVVFRSNGTIVSTKQGENVQSGDGGDFASSGSNGETGYWKVSAGQVYLSEDGQTWEPLNLTLTFNSNGAPILKADGKEFTRCR